jgi:hypothetical protein
MIHLKRNDHSISWLGQPLINAQKSVVNSKWNRSENRPHFILVIMEQGNAWIIKEMWPVRGQKHVCVEAIYLNCCGGNYARSFNFTIQRGDHYPVLFTWTRPHIAVPSNRVFFTLKLLAVRNLKLLLCLYCSELLQTCSVTCSVRQKPTICNAHYTLSFHLSGQRHFSGLTTEGREITD